jgi:hypothetical protein
MYYTVLVKGICFTEDLWYRVGIYVEAHNAMAAEGFIQTAFGECITQIVNFKSMSDACAAYPKQLPAAAVLPFAIQLLELNGDPDEVLSGAAKDL